MKKSSFFGLTLVSVAVVALAVFAEHFDSNDKTMGENANSYSLNLNSANAPTDFSSYSSLTSSGNSVAFAFSGGSSVTGKFCSLASGSYFENTTPIHSLTSITVSFTGTLGITFGKFSLDNVSSEYKNSAYQGFGNVLTSGTAFTFNTEPCYFRLSATADTTIENVIANYSCPNTPSLSTILGIRALNTEKAYCYSKGVVTRIVSQTAFYVQCAETIADSYGIEFQRLKTLPAVAVGDSINFEGLLSIQYSRFRLLYGNLSVRAAADAYAAPVPLQLNEGDYTLDNMNGTNGFDGNDGRLVSLSNISNNSITTVASNTTYTFKQGTNNITLFIKTSDSSKISTFNETLAALTATQRLRYTGVVVIHNTTLEIILIDPALDFEVYDTVNVTGYYLTGSINSWDKRDTNYILTSVTKTGSDSWDYKYKLSIALAVNDVVKAVYSAPTKESDWIWFGYTADSGDAAHNIGLSNSSAQSANFQGGDYRNIKVLAAGTYDFVITLTGTSYVFTIEGGSTPVGEDMPLDIYAVNDTHGTIAANADNMEPGMAALGGFINDLRTTAGGIDKTVLLSSGDMWQGSLDSNITQGEMMIDMMKALKFDSMTIGNHEFDWGRTKLAENIAKAADTTDDAWGYPTLAINIKDTSSNEYILGSPSTTFVRNGLTVSIIGAIGEVESSIASNLLTNIDFVDPTPLVKAEATRLREAGSDIIIYSVHNGAANSGANDYPDASLADYVDCVFTSHTHRTEAYTITSGTTSRSVPVVQSWCNGKIVGHIKLNYNTATEKVTTSAYENTSYVVNATPTPDATVTSIYNSYQTKSYTDGPLTATIASIKDTTLGTIASTSSYVSSGSVSQNSVNKLYTKAQLDMYSSDEPVLSYNNASRTSWSVGDITYADIYKAFPFDNDTYVLTVTGAQIKATNAGGYGWISSESSYTFKDGVTSLTLVDETVYTVISTSYAITNYNYPYTSITRIDDSSSHSQRHILYNAFVANPSRFN